MRRRGVLGVRGATALLAALLAVGAIAVAPGAEHAGDAAEHAGDAAEHAGDAPAPTHEEAADDEPDGAEPAHRHGDEDERHGDGDDHAVPAFRVADFERRGVRVATAGAGTVDLGVELPGEVQANGDRIAHLAPRFPGLVREVRKRVGDPVRAGEVLAVVESETLAPFELKAAFDGVVIDRHVVPGEAVSRETPAFIVADLSTVWIDVHVYQSALADLRLGQPVRITGPAGAVAEGRVSYIAPVFEQATRTASARVVLPNPTGAWRPGLFVNVTVLTPVEAPVVVASEAIHRLDDRPVVFVVEGDGFVARPVTVGRRGRTTAAITAGLAPGERYAEAGSFLVKAELAKGEAGHEH